MSNSASASASTHPRYLLLLDLNGTILLRSDKLVKKMRAAGKAGRKHLYGRPGTRGLIRQLSASGCFTLCIYTSMKRVNATASLQAILGDDSRLISHLLDRKFCRIDPTGANNWDTMRDMQKVWRLFPQFGLTNTILIDNEARKFREAPLNGIEIPEISKAEIFNASSSVIDNVRNYLLDLGRASPPDVRDYIRQYPFSMPLPVRVTTDSSSRNQSQIQIVDEAMDDLQSLAVDKTTSNPTLADANSKGSISPRTRLYVIVVEEKQVVLRDSDGRVLVTAEVDESKRAIGSSIEFGSLNRVINVSRVDA